MVIEKPKQLLNTIRISLELIENTYIIFNTLYFPTSSIFIVKDFTPHECVCYYLNKNNNILLTFFE